MSKDKPIKPKRENKDSHIRIEDENSTEMYKAGFRFAINYIYAKLSQEETQKLLNKEGFEKFLEDELIVGVDKDFFKSNAILFDGAGGPYVDPWCPGPRPSHCVLCPDAAIRPIKD